MNPIELHDVRLNFGKFQALDSLSMHVEPQSIHGFLGPNGAGKSTTIRVLLGLLRPASGSVSVLGRNPIDEPTVLKRVGYVPGDINLWPQLTGRETLTALARLRGRAVEPQREQALIDAFELDLHKHCRDYSTGNRRKVLLISALSAGAELLILDEPTAGLDPLMERVFVEQLRKERDRGATILLSSHILSEVEQLCNNVTVIKSGRAVEHGSIDTLRKLAGFTIRATMPNGDRMEQPIMRNEANHRLQELLDLDATDISVQPATLEETFLRHYLQESEIVGKDQ